MAAPPNTCTTIEQRGVVRFLWAKRYGSKGYPQRNADHVGWTLPVMSSSPLKRYISGEHFSWRWRDWKSSVRVVPTATTKILRRRFPGTCETVGQVFKFVWRLCWKINAVCMSLSPFVSFQLRFVTYLLTYPRIIPLYSRKTPRWTVHKVIKLTLRTRSTPQCFGQSIKWYN